MQHAIDVVVSLIAGLFGLIVAGIAAVEHVLREALIPTGIGRDGQNLVLLAVAVLLIIAAIRLFGGIFAVLISIVLVLLILHVLLPGLGVRGLGAHG